MKISHLTTIIAAGLFAASFASAEPSSKKEGSGQGSHTEGRVNGHDVSVDTDHSGTHTTIDGKSGTTSGGTSKDEHKRMVREQITHAGGHVSETNVCEHDHK